MLDKNTKPMSMIAEIVTIAEHSTYLDLTSKICYYDAPNLNGDMLPYDDTTLSKAETLISMPVQAKYRVNANGEPSLGGHEMVKKRDGTIEFKTQSIGVHTSVEIRNDNVVLNNGEIKELPCLFASYRIWKRYPNYIAAVKRLYENNMLYGSWEINTYKYEYDNGICKITDYEFFANTLLGELNPPSYGTNATALSMAQLNDNSQLLVAEALAKDLIDENENKEDNTGMAKQNNSAVAENVTDVKTPTDTDSTTTDTANTNMAEQINTSDNVGTNEPSVEIAQLTEWDLRNKIAKACADKIDKSWCYIAYHFPVEKEVWCEYSGAPSELDYARFTYDVSNDVVTVSEVEYVKLTVSIAEVNTKISEMEKEIQTVKAELDIKNDAITKASETIQNLNTQISELAPYKEQVEVAERKKIEEQITAEKEALKNKLLKGNLFTEAEIAEKEIQDLIESRDVSAINSLIADKFVASFDVDHKNENVETVSTAKTVVTATANLESEDTETDVRSFMSKILSN